MLTIRHLEDKLLIVNCQLIMSYLQEVITDVLENYPDKIERLVFVTTGKRPTLFLKKHFAEQVK